MPTHDKPSRDILVDDLIATKQTKAVTLVERLENIATGKEARIAHIYKACKEAAEALGSQAFAAARSHNVTFEKWLRYQPWHAPEFGGGKLYDADTVRAAWNAAPQSEGTRDTGLPDAGQSEPADAALSPGRPAAVAAPNSSALPQEPVAWLYSYAKPGKRVEFASIDPNDTTEWPLDQWASVKKQPLYLAPESATSPTNADAKEEQR